MSAKQRSILAAIGWILGILVLIPCLHAQEQPHVSIETIPLAENLFLLRDSQGMGNTVVLTGDDGVLMIDTKLKTSVDKLLDSIGELSDQPIRFALNTHWHFDHVGGNETVAGRGVTIIAQENVRKQMSIAHDMKFLNTAVPPSPASARPLITYSQAMAFHLNGEDVRIFHPGPGHTDGDSVIYFPNANVIHMGDLYFEGLYPYIGIYSGGTINGMIGAINRILPMIDTQTKVVPGHGPLSDKTRLEAYVSMLTTIRDNVARLMQAGRTIEDVVAAKPTQAFDQAWGDGFLPPDQFARLVYMDLAPDLP